MKLAITKRITDEYVDVNPKYLEMLNRAHIDYVAVGLDDDIDMIIDSCDGLLVPGGIDVNPRLYNQEPNGYVKTKYTDETDKIDYKWIKAFNDKHKLIFGICRGIQIINVYFGGSLIQDIGDSHKDGVMHNIRVDKDSFLYACYKKEVMEVNSYHHEVINKLGNGLKVVARSMDNYIEAIEGDDIYALQWHPEKANDDTIINYLKSKCDQISR